MNLYATSFIKILAVLAAVAIVLLILFLFVSSINKTYTSGKHYGFKIGESKESVFVGIPANLKNIVESQNFHVEIFNDKTKVPLQVETRFQPDEFKLLETGNRWRIFFDTAFFYDNIILTFCDNELCEIKRKRQYFELP
jgi:hypothetical protein